METIETTKMNIVHVASEDELAKAALDTFAKDADKAIREKGSFNVAISGGQTPVGFYELLGTKVNDLSIDWPKVQLFWVDERCVPPQAQPSNYGLAAHTFLDKVPIPKQNIHRVIGESKSYAEAVREYEESIRRVFNVVTSKCNAADGIVLAQVRHLNLRSLQ